MRPYIVVVNDDGIYSEGLRAAAIAAARVGDVVVAAPVTQQTAMGRSFPRMQDTGIIEEVPDYMEGVKAYGVHGSPAYCSFFGIAELSERKPDLLLSGINIGNNIGLSMTCSGTIGAAFEARAYNVPALAVSLEADAEVVLDDTVSMDVYQYAIEITEYWIRKVLAERGEHPEYDFLNVNVPAGPIDTETYEFTFVENQNYYIHEPIPKNRDRSKPFNPGFLIEVDEDALHPGSDIYAIVKERTTSVTPMSLDYTRNEKNWF